VPYLVQDGAMLLISGSCDGEWASQALAADGLRPIIDASGRALAAIWVADFATASLGAHGELQFSLFASDSIAALPAAPWAVYRLLAGTGPAVMVCHRLWNTTERVVRYNTDQLSLDARLATGGLRRAGRSWEFEFVDAAGAPISAGSAGVPSRTRLSVLLKFAAELGPRSFWRLGRADHLSMPVTGGHRNADGSLLVSGTFTGTQNSVLKPFATSDKLEIRDPTLRAADFRPLSLTAMTGVEFVYLPAEPE
jgi:hypothetical protein